MNRCKRMSVHAMGIDRDGNIEWATNYSPGECTGEAGNCGCIHAEDALLQIMPNPQTVVISHSPCVKCAELLHNAGVEFVYYLKPYRITDGIDFLEDKATIRKLGNDFSLI